MDIGIDDQHVGLARDQRFGAVTRVRRVDVGGGVAAAGHLDQRRDVRAVADREDRRGAEHDEHRRRARVRLARAQRAPPFARASARRAPAACARARSARRSRVRLREDVVVAVVVQAAAARMPARRRSPAKRSCATIPTTTSACSATMRSVAIDENVATTGSRFACRRIVGERRDADDHRRPRRPRTDLRSSTAPAKRCDARPTIRLGAHAGRLRRSGTAARSARRARAERTVTGEQYAGPSRGTWDEDARRSRPNTAGSSRAREAGVESGTVAPLSAGSRRGHGPRGLEGRSTRHRSAKSGYRRADVCSSAPLHPRVKGKDLDDVPHVRGADRRTRRRSAPHPRSRNPRPRRLPRRSPRSAACRPPTAATSRCATPSRRRSSSPKPR